MNTYADMNVPSKAIVVGGGPAGLLAAAHLAAGGVETTLLEASSHLGGRAASERRDGFDLNQGPHALYVGGPAMRELRGLGIDLPRWNPTSAYSVFPRGGRARLLPAGAPVLTRWLLGAARRQPASLAEISAAEWLRRTLPSARARASAAALIRVTTFVADQETLSADVAAGQLAIGLWPGVRYLRGGWQSLVDALAAAAERAGASLRTGAGVRGLERERDGWALALDEETLRADAVVVAAGGPADFAKLLGERAPQAPGPAAEISSLDLGLERMPRRTRRFALGIDTPSYLSRHSPPDHRDGVLLSLGGYARQPRAELEAFADCVQPGWREVVKLERFLPRMTPITALATPASGGLAGRPAVDRGEGLFLAGDWLGPEGWLVDAALASGAAAAAAALRSGVSAAA